MSVGLGGKIDGADQGDKANGETRKDGGEENACKAFSKDLIVRAIGKPPPTPPKEGSASRGKGCLDPLS